MASSLAGAACRRASARLARSRSVSRGFTSSARCLAAQNFVMPALSPTMTEGNIATWKVKEGETFAAGDVLLEIETDKATMDVEAQEDGIVMRIMEQDGAKAVQVGARIAVLAEAGDDIKTLAIPEHAQVQQDVGAGSSSAPPSAAKEDAASGAKVQKSRPAGNEVHELKYPLMPSVETLMHQHGLSKEDVSRIKPTGPNGRLLKGDVLAHIGAINADSPVAVSSFFEKLSHLDLSNIKVAEKKPTPTAAAAAAAAADAASKEAADKAAQASRVQPSEVNVPVSLAKVIEVQRRIQETLGVSMPLSTFISRAAEVANDDLPPAKRAPTADELFDQLLGLDKVKAAKGTRGMYLPQISAVPPSTLLGRPAQKAAAAAAANSKADIIDVLTAKPKKAVGGPGVSSIPGLSSGLNVFSLVVPREEEHRAHIFLERCKAILEQEPGRLVL